MWTWVKNSMQISVQSLKKNSSRGRTKRKIRMRREILLRKTPMKTLITLIKSLSLLLLLYKKTYLLGKSWTRTSSKHSLTLYLKGTKNSETTYQIIHIQFLLIIFRAIRHSQILSIQRSQMRKTLQFQRKSLLLPGSNLLLR